MITLEKIKDGIDMDVILYEKTGPIRKSKISYLGTELFISDDKVSLQLDLEKSIIICSRLYPQTRIIEILTDDKSYYLSPSTLIDREQLYHCFNLIKYPQFTILNFYPLHRWLRIRKRNVSEDESCCVCNQTIHQKHNKFIVCDICGLCVHDNHTWDLDKQCRSPGIFSSKFYDERNSIKKIINNFLPNNQDQFYSARLSLEKSPAKFVGDNTHCFQSSRLLGNETTNSSYFIDPFNVVINESTFELLNMDDHDTWPLFVIINIRGGNNMGIEFARAFRCLLNTIQVWEIPTYSVDEIFKILKGVKRFRLIIGGGDGTVGWVMGEIKNANIKAENIKIAPLPLGTGNDFSRVFGWGAGINKTTKIRSFLNWVDYSVPVSLDRWKICIYSLKPQKLTSKYKSEDREIPQNILLCLAETIIAYLFKIYTSKSTRHQEKQLMYVCTYIDEFIEGSRAYMKEYMRATPKAQYTFYSCYDEVNLTIQILNREFNILKLFYKIGMNNKIIKRTLSTESIHIDQVQETPGNPKKYSEPIKLEFNYYAEDKTMLNDDIIFNRTDLLKSGISKERIFTSIWKSIDKIVHFITQKPYKQLITVECDKKHKVNYFNNFSTSISSKYVNFNEYPVEHYYKNMIKVYYMNNYFGIGLDAKISHDFSVKREDNPNFLDNRMMNKLYYIYLGTKELIINSCQNMQSHILVECDGIPIQLPQSQALVVLNIPSYMGGGDFWGGTHLKGFTKQSYNDGILEVCAVTGIDQLGMVRLFGCPKNCRVAQCRRVTITLLDDTVPIHIDGEAFYHGPCVIEIKYDNTFFVLKRQKKLQTTEDVPGKDNQLTTETGCKKSSLMVYRNIINEYFRSINELISELKKENSHFRHMFKHQIIDISQVLEVNKANVDAFCQIYYKINVEFYKNMLNSKESQFSISTGNRLVCLHKLLMNCERIISNII